MVFPTGRPSTAGLPTVDKGSTDALITTKIVPNTGVPGSQVFGLYPTPDTPSNDQVLWPALLIEASPAKIVLGEMDNVFWVSAQGEVTNMVAEDVINIGADTYIVYQLANRTDVWAHFCVKRS